ncbi:hypothetical protein HFO56_02420 [Rhizobium laguerreae]|uniref:hypothetical protein n=1 Tax=Rhizobium laguerreae TaxID=1076926 RepID=UPI001C91E7CB|nr:hypothetical protein [Rhizobium laguerreae]MBY3151239.1 hypothetical protein [Rhizobium laguerreae]MBY3433431.1 hypothetical protein [Rhizobium laguerreae]
MTSQHVSVHNGEEILWTEREGVFNAFYGGYHILIERVIPTPVAITADRVVISISPRRFRAFVDGALPDPENEFFETLDAAMQAAANLMIASVHSIVRSRRDRFSLLAEKPVRYEDWV